jgi:hypothetical protein
MSGDPEFEDFLKRRRPLFRRDVDDGLEPPAELDRIVLRQARDAIEGERPLRLFGMPRWAAPVAIAATLVLGLSIVFKTGLEPDARIPEVRVENVAQRVDYPAAPVAGPAAEATAPTRVTPGAVVVDLAAQAPAWRRDARSWQAEIERLRANGNQALADAEQAEYNRQYRAYAVSPDR